MARKLAAIHFIDYDNALRVLGKTQDKSTKLAILDFIDMMNVLLPGIDDTYEDPLKEEM